MFEADYTLGTSRWQVVRLRTGCKCEAVLLSPRFFCVTTHWTDRTILCCVDNCPLCELLPWRGLFYVAAHVAGRIHLIELGAQAAGHFEQHCKLLHGGMKPGLVVEFSRSGSKTPIYSEVVRFQENVVPVTQLEIAQRVLAIYKYPPPNPGELLERYEERVRASCRLRCENAAAAIKRRVAKK